jgi:hypothetical protein
MEFPKTLDEEDMELFLKEVRLVGLVVRGPYDYWGDVGREIALLPGETHGVVISEMEDYSTIFTQGAALYRLQDGAWNLRVGWDCVYRRGVNEIP